MSYNWTSECVGRGHPDKVADQISDAVLDACLEQDPFSRVACETLVKDRHVILAGEITTKAEVGYDEIVRKTLKEIGYHYEPMIQSLLSEQSPEISAAVGKESEGAGDQGIMFGFACNDTPEMMPLASSISRFLVNTLYKLSLEPDSQLLPDCKTQVTLRVRDGVSTVEKVLVSTHHKPQGKEFEAFKSRLENRLVREFAYKYAGKVGSVWEWLINPAGPWEFGGPEADCGLTGRKIVVDAYGADCPLGGGAFSSKDPTKVDRSAAYMARYIAKNIVSAGYANKATVQLSYAIGVAEPTSFRVMTDNATQDKVLADFVKSKVDLRPRAIIERLDLRRPIYLQTSREGHFGFEGSDSQVRTWERCDLF